MTSDVRLVRFRLKGARFAVFSEPIVRQPPEALTASEDEVMRLLLAGLSNREIGRRRGRAERTVANQIASLFRKLSVSSRAELVSRHATGR